MATYRHKFGAPDKTAKGPLATYLGDPSKYGSISDFNPRGYIFLGIVDSFGNPFLVLGANEDGSSVYDVEPWIHTDAAGSAAARDIFLSIEAANSASLGLDCNLDYAIGPPLGTNGWDDSRNALLPKGSTGDGMTGYDSVHPSRYAKETADAFNYCRGFVYTTLTTPDGHSYTAVCVVNFWLRIGYILYVEGPPADNIPLVTALIKTGVSILVIIVSIVTWNVGGIVAGFGGIIQAWYQFSTQMDDYRKAEKAIGDGILSHGKLVGGKRTTALTMHAIRSLSDGSVFDSVAAALAGVPAAPDWIDRLKEILWPTKH